MAAPTQHPQSPAQPTSSATTSATATSDSGGDHLAKLHKMSTTAGLGSTDYVAVNNPAVIALLLGLASAAVLIDPVFFILPVAGLVCSVIAINQIRKSNGTQTGLALAGLGLLLTFSFSAFVAYTAISQRMDNNRQSAAIGATLKQFEQHLAAGEWDKAYQLMGPRFKEKIKEEDFASNFKSLEAHPYYGRLKDIDWNGQLATEVDPTTNVRWARALTRMNYTKAGQAQGRNQFVLQNVNGEWKIEQISSYFGAEPYN